MTRCLFNGTIIGMYREQASGIALLAIEDEKKGNTLIPCEGTPTARAFDATFGGVLVEGRFNNDAIAGKQIYYSLDELGALEAFTPVEMAPQGLVEEYEEARKAERAAKKAPSQKKGRLARLTRVSDLGFLGAEDRVYTTGPIVAGRLLDPRSNKSTH